MLYIVYLALLGVMWWCTKSIKDPHSAGWCILAPIPLLPFWVPLAIAGMIIFLIAYILIIKLLLAEK